MSYEFYPSVMNSKARLTYTSVDKILNHDDKNLKSEFGSIVQPLTQHMRISNISSDRTEVELEFDSTETNIGLMNLYN